LGPLATVGLLLAALIGAEFVAARGDVIKSVSPLSRHRALLHLYVPLQIGLVAWAIAAAGGTTGLGIASLALSVGVTTGVFGMLTAHELIHSKSRRERMLGTLMLSAMSYRHFRVAHVHVHHRFAATEHDSATARLGEGFYAFLLRTVRGQFLEAWLFERTRCVRRSVFSNRMVVDIALTVLIVAAIFAIWGGIGVALFAAQCAVGIIVLELFNYIAHYGLVRRVGIGGRVESLSDCHSWNSSNVWVNLLIFNMGRHSYHHRRPSASYQNLEFVRQAPELPAGYAGSILLALVPPLWRRVMDKEVLKHQAVISAVPALPPEIVLS